MQIVLYLTRASYLEAIVVNNRFKNKFDIVGMIWQYGWSQAEHAIRKK